jgi:predicted nucleic acid-binding protein
MLTVAVGRASSVKVRSKFKYCKSDPSDNKFVNCAIDGDANFIVTADIGDLIKVKDAVYEKHEIEIVTPEEFLRLLLKYSTEQSRC